MCRSGRMYRPFASTFATQLAFWSTAERATRSISCALKKLKWLENSLLMSAAERSWLKRTSKERISTRKLISPGAFRLMFDMAVLELLVRALDCFDKIGYRKFCIFLSNLIYFLFWSFWIQALSSSKLETASKPTNPFRVNFNLSCCEKTRFMKVFICTYLARCLPSSSRICENLQKSPIPATSRATKWGPASRRN